MLWKRFLSRLLVLTLVAATVVWPFSATWAQKSVQAKAPAATAGSASDLNAQLAAIEQELEAKRKAYGIPGMSLVIVKDDEVIYIKGFGVKNVESNAPVTPDTLFAIGSATKAFTGLSAMLAVDEGKLSLDDAPKKYLPYFKLSDPEANEKITVRDLLSHSSGLNRTDLAFAVGTLSREEVIRVAGMAKPTAKLREKFQYQNAMYSAAGEVVGRAMGKSWEDVVRERIFKPLGMRASDLSVKEMEKSKDYSYGYTYNTDTKQNRRVPMRDIPSAAPAGAINSSARDMARWLRFLLAGGVIAGKRLVSEKSFHELVTEQMKVAGAVGYGLGWFLRDWQGHKVAEHGGNIDGFNAQVAFMPDQNLGFALLTNITASPIGNDAMNSIWAKLVGAPQEEGAQQAEATTATGGESVEPKRFVGTYKFAEAGMNIEVAMVDGKLLMTVPGQPQYALETVSGRRYKLIYPGLEGFYATFRPVKDKADEIELYLEQPQGNYVLQRINAADAAREAEADANYDGPLKELIGSYQSEKGQAVVEIAVKSGKVALVVPGQPPYPLVEKEKDVYALSPLPDGYRLLVKRDETGKVASIVSAQPEGSFTFNRIAEFTPPLPVAELIAKVVEAAGGEAVRKHTTMVTKVSLNLENQGITAEGTIYAKAPDKQASDFTLMALGKKIGTTFEYFDGTNGGQNTSFTPPDVYTGKQLANTRIAANFYGLLEWKTLFQKAEIKRMAKVGEEDAYVLVLTSEKGTPMTLYVSPKTYMVLRRDTLIATSDSSGIELLVTETYSDYRSVDGVMIPFKIKTYTPPQGNIVTNIKEVSFDVELADARFRPQPAK